MSSRRSRSAQGTDSKTKETNSRSTKRKETDDPDASGVQSNEDKKKATRANGESNEYSDVNGSSSTRSKKKLNDDVNEAGPSGIDKNKESEMNNDHELSNGEGSEELEINEQPERNRDNKKKRKANDNEDDDDKKKNNDGDKTSGDEENFEVSKIIDVKIVRNRRSFLVRWKGYGSDDDTWEPEDNLNCPELLENFLNKIKEVPEKQQKRQRPQTNRYSAHENAKRSSKRTSGQKKNYSED